MRNMWQHRAMGPHMRPENWPLLVRVGAGGLDRLCGVAGCPLARSLSEEGLCSIRPLAHSGPCTSPGQQVYLWVRLGCPQAMQGPWEQTTASRGCIVTGCVLGLHLWGLDAQGQAQSAGAPQP